MTFFIMSQNKMTSARMSIISITFKQFAAVTVNDTIVECPSADCHSADCHSYECRGGIFLFSSQFRQMKKNKLKVAPRYLDQGILTVGEGRLSTVDLLIKVACFVKY
jgi:hypothetical protein